MTEYEKRRLELGIEHQIKEFFKRGGEVEQIEGGKQSAKLDKIMFNNKKKDGTKLIKN